MKNIPDAVIDPEMTLEKSIQIIRANLWCHTLEIWQLRSAEAKLLSEYEKLHSAHEELLYYLPKVPTEPNEKMLAKRCHELSEKLVKALKTMKLVQKCEKEIDDGWEKRLGYECTNELNATISEIESETKHG